MAKKAKKKRKKKPWRTVLSRKADKALSEYTREFTRRNYGDKCPLCEKKPIQCCFHFITRRRKILRWNGRNVIGSCHTCNYIERYFPDLSRAWYIRMFGVDAYLGLVDAARKNFEPTKAYLEDIIAHYKESLKILVNSDKPGGLT